MQLKDSTNQYGLVSKLLHWLSALVIFALFGVGLWMVDLTYYSEWYKTAPHWHKSIGILLLITTLFRLGWKFFTPSPAPIAEHSNTIKKATKFGHLALYMLMIIIMISGYLISTADGRAIEVFNWFSVPSLGQLFAQQEDIAGEIHEIAAFALIGFALLHALAAIKHKIIDKDTTLERML